MIKKYFCILIFFAFTSSALAKDYSDKWIDLWKTKNGETKFQVKLSSFKYFLNMSQSNTFSILSRWIHKDGSIRFVKYSITDTDCEQGYGQLSENDLGTLDYENETYVKNGGNGTSLIGDLLCEMGLFESQKN